MTSLPKIAVILTGGTIDSVGKDRLDLAWYIEAGKRLGEGELLGSLPELKSIADVQEVRFAACPVTRWSIATGSNSYERLMRSLSPAKLMVSSLRTASTRSKRPPISCTSP